MVDKKDNEIKIELDDNSIEYITLNRFYNDSDYISLILNNFQSKFFLNKPLSNIINILIQYYKKYEKMPVKNTLDLILKRYCEKHEESYKKYDIELNNSLNFKLSDDDKFIKDNIVNYIKSKSIYNVIMDELDHIEKNKDVSGCLDRFQKILQINMDENVGLNYFSELDKHFDEVSSPESMITTGYNGIDYVTNGGFPKNGKCLCTFVAESGLGKSLIMSNLAVNFMKEGLFPLIISLEMPEMIYGKRIDAHISKEDINTLQHNVESAKKKIKDFHALHKNSNLIIKEFPPNTINCNNIQVYMDKLSSLGKHPDVLIVDYINLLNSNNRQESGMYERVGDISRQLRALSYRYNIPVISASQVNREGFSTSDVDMSNVSESMGIVHTSDFLAALYQQEGDREANRLNIKILKNRFGGMIGRKLKFHINYNNLRITDEITDQHSESLEEDILDDLIGDV